MQIAKIIQEENCDRAASSHSSSSTAHMFTAPKFQLKYQVSSNIIISIVSKLVLVTFLFDLGLGVR